MWRLERSSILLQCVSFTVPFASPVLSSMQMRLRVRCDLALPGVGNRRRGHAQLPLRLRAAGRRLNRLNG
jgi:hypothetical protein